MTEEEFKKRLLPIKKQLAIFSNWSDGKTPSQLKEYDSVAYWYSYWSTTQICISFHGIMNEANNRYKQILKLNQQL